MEKEFSFEAEAAEAAEFEKEIERSLQRMSEAIEPYTRFVRAETSRSDQVQQELKTARLELENLRLIIANWQ